MSLDLVFAWLFSLFSEPFAYAAGVVLCLSVLALFAWSVNRVGKSSRKGGIEA